MESPDPDAEPIEDDGRWFQWRPHWPDWTRAERLAWISFAAFAVSAFAVTLSLIALHESNHRADVNQAKANAGVGAATSANAALSAAGLPTVAIPSSAAAPTATVTLTGAQGPSGINGSGPSAAEVSAAVTLYCDTHACGTPPTAADIAAAIVVYCQAHAGCVGATGPQGAQGPAGQNASADQIAAAVVNYCQANNACQGPTGADGGAGPVGPQGPEIPSFTFTDEFGVKYVCSPPDQGTQYECTPN